MDPRITIATITRIVSHEFGNSRPLIVEQAVAADDVIHNGDNATQAHLDLVSQLPLSAFINLNVTQQWNDVQAHLWRSIQIAFNDMALGTPDNWGPGLEIVRIANYV